MTKDPHLDMEFSAKEAQNRRIAQGDLPVDPQDETYDRARGLKGTPDQGEGTWLA